MGKENKYEINKIGNMKIGTGAAWFFIWIILISGDPDIIDGIVYFLQNF